jgi:uncharacterized membrane protein
MGRKLQEDGIHVTETVTIQRPPTQIYQFWRDFSNLPRVMRHLKSVEILDNQHSHWVAKAPAGTSVEWDAEIVADRPNELITWRSSEGTGIENAGAVHFNALPGGQGTEVRVELRYNPPGGAVGAAFAKLFGEEPGQQVEEDLQRFKEIMEAGQAT